ncbi:NAD(P)/FAD-dependent oxidoreductase [Agrobacterium sp. ES01]|uniref:NAD(P)/FAD-dependent oxidoreductase n=1 Tax=Agrobacterium sp. ES01 TaxID=3420714 RepID=UPI003D0F1F4C
MSERFESIVIGAGMMGAAAAKYLARQSHGVALIGPGEPADTAGHSGVFASHYDEARITRTIDANENWARLAHRSIARYADIATESGISFYEEAGCLIVGPEPHGPDCYIADVKSAAERLAVKTQTLDDAQLGPEFPYFSFEQGSEGVFEQANAGYVNPRRLVKAQGVLAHQAGARLIEETVASVREQATGVEVATFEGQTYLADRVLVAAGGFSIAAGLLPRRLDLQVFARTVALFEIAEAEAGDYAGMPSLISAPSVPTDHIYLLPPVRYPDGRLYLKIGGDPDDLVLQDEAAVRAWFHSGGRESTRLHLKRIAEGLVPSLKGIEPHMAACVTSFTPNNYPAIGYASERIAVLAGGCGQAAKSSDEIGRLGAEMLLRGHIEGNDYSADFTPQFL